MNRLNLEERKKANKVRCKLLYTIDRDIRETKKTNQNHILINSMSLQELEDKFLLFPNYKMKLSTTFTKLANKYIVMQTVDNNLGENFYYTDYLQDQKKVSHYKVKQERKRISANNIIKLPLLVDIQELQSPIPEIFTTKMNIGDKKLIKPKEVENYDNIKKNEINNNKKIESTKYDENKDENGKARIKNVAFKNKNKEINNNDDDSCIYSLTLELIQKKGSMITESLNNNNKKELKRRKKQLESIRKLRQFCFQKLKNKRRCITKSSHQNLLYINNKLDDEDEKNNSNNTIKKNNNIKINSRNIKYKNGKNNSKKKYDTINESKIKKTPKKNKNKKQFDNNSTTRSMFKNNSSKRIPIKVKRNTTQRKSLILNRNILSGRIDRDILRFKKKKKEKNSINFSISPSNDETTEKFNKQKYQKTKTGILRESSKDKPKIVNLKKNLFLNLVKAKMKNNNVNFNDNNSTKRNSSSNNFFNRKNKSRQNNVIYSSRCLIKPVIKFRLKKTSESKSARKRRFSSPDKMPKKNEKENDNKESKSERSYIMEKFKNKKADLKKAYTKNINKERIYNSINNNLGRRNSLIWNLKKNKIQNEMQKVVEEDD